MNSKPKCNNNLQSSITGHGYNWVSRRRIRAHATIMLAVTWIAYFISMATPGMLDRFGQLKGSDFQYFYTIGSLALEHRGDLLWDIPAQTRRARELIPQAHLEYVPAYGPQVPMMVAPFALLHYKYALLLWMAISFGLYAAACYAIWRTCENLQRERSTCALLALAFPPLFFVLGSGQISIFALALIALGYLALRSQRMFLAGFAIGALVFKPQLGLPFAVLLLAACEWKLIAGALTSAAAQFLAAWAWFGGHVFRDYVNGLLQLRGIMDALEPPSYLHASVYGFCKMLLPQSAVAFGIYVFIAAITVVALIRTWRRPTPLSLRYSLVVLGTVLLSPHLEAYDLVVLAPAFLLLSDWAIGHLRGTDQGRVRVALYAAYVLIVFSPVWRIVHLQVAVVAIVALFVVALQIVLRHTQEVRRLAVNAVGAE
jgi:hypothetical protein